MLLHLVIVSSTLEGWAEYITTQQDVLERFENKSFFSDADHDTQNDFKLGFEDSQALQHLRRKLIKAMAVLEGGNNLCNRLFGVFEAMETPTQTNAGGLRPFLTKGLSETLVAELKDIISNISYHRQRLVDLQQRSSNATNLVGDASLLLPAAVFVIFAYVDLLTDGQSCSAFSNTASATPVSEVPVRMRHRRRQTRDPSTS
jgi:hypothetical protein